jgi:hypothetical protein
MDRAEFGPEFGARLGRKTSHSTYKKRDLGRDWAKPYTSLRTFSWAKAQYHATLFRVPVMLILFYGFIWFFVFLSFYFLFFTV